MSQFLSGTSKTTQIGYINRHEQRCTGTQGIAGSEANQYSYRMQCLRDGCGEIYGTNGFDIHNRKCPTCQDAQPGIEY